MNRLLQILDGRKVAIVGNGPEAQDRSAEIDSADVVVRFNDFYNYDSGRVGKRVDVVLQTVASAWFERFKAGKLEASLKAVREQRPAIFLVKRPDNYRTDTHAVYGEGVRVDNLARFFEPWWKYTTGGAALSYLAANLVNAEVRAYGFARGNDPAWRAYVAGDAKHYADVADEERAAVTAAIDTLESLRISRPGEGKVPRCVVVPVKAVSQGAPGKNRALLRRCLEKLRDAECPVSGWHVFCTGDDIELLHEVRDLCTPVPLPAIAALADVTDTLRKWQVETGFCGDVVLAQCTSPGLRPEWIERCFNALARAPVAATCVELGFKPTAIFRKENNVWVPASQALPAATVARQLLPPAVRFTGACTAFHTDALACDSLFQAGVMEPVMVCEEDSLDVDTPEQLAEAVKERRRAEYNVHEGE